MNQDINYHTVPKTEEDYTHALRVSSVTLAMIKEIAVKTVEKMLGTDRDLGPNSLLHELIEGSVSNAISQCLYREIRHAR